MLKLQLGQQVPAGNKGGLCEYHRSITREVHREVQQSQRAARATEQCTTERECPELHPTALTTRQRSRTPVALTMGQSFRAPHGTTVEQR